MYHEYFDKILNSISSLLTCPTSNYFCLIAYNVLSLYSLVMSRYILLLQLMIFQYSQDPADLEYRIYTKRLYQYIAIK